MLASVPSLASAEPTDSFFLALGGGANWLDDVKAKAVTNFGSPPLEVGFDTGWAAEATTGYHWDLLRIELELSYRANDLESFRFGSPQTTISGDESQFAQMLNVLLDIPLGDTLALTLGGGVGGVLVDIDISGRTVIGETVLLDGDDYVFAYQGIAGLSVDVGERTEVFAEYHYFVTEDADLGGVLLPGFTPYTTRDFDVTKHTALIGLRYYFGEAVAAVEEVAPAPAAPAQTSFTVLFDFNKSNLTAEGHAAVAEAAEAFKSGASPVTIEAQGDGDPSRDQDLGARRGAAVKAALVDLGVPAEKITVETREGGDAVVTIQ